MKPWQINILIIIGVVLLMVLPVPLRVIQLIILASVIWVYIDARKLGMGKYKSTLFGRGPISYAICVNILWIVGMPYYISHRQKVIDGKWPLQEQK